MRSVASVAARAAAGMDHPTIPAARGRASRYGRGPPFLLGALALGITVPACVSGEEHQTTAPQVVALSRETPPLFGAAGEEDAIYQVSLPVRLPVRQPTEAEESALGEMVPYPRAPFVEAKHVRVEVRFTLSNLDDEPRTVELLLDPWNEFARYRPGILDAGDDEEAVPNFSAVDRFFVLPPRGRIEGVLTADDLREASVDLATAMNLLAQSAETPGALMNRAMNPQNRSSQPDPLLSPFVPAVIAGMTGFDLGLRARAAVNVAVEVTADVDDLEGDRLADPTSGKPTFDEPGNTIEPPAAAPGG